MRSRSRIDDSNALFLQHGYRAAASRMVVEDMATMPLQLMYRMSWVLPKTSPYAIRPLVDSFSGDEEVWDSAIARANAFKIVLEGVVRHHRHDLPVILAMLMDVEDPSSEVFESVLLFYDDGVSDLMRCVAFDFVERYMGESAWRPIVLSKLDRRSLGSGCGRRRLEAKVDVTALYENLKRANFDASRGAVLWDSGEEGKMRLTFFAQDVPKNRQRFMVKTVGIRVSAAEAGAGATVVVQVLTTNAVYRHRGALNGTVTPRFCLADYLDGTFLFGGRYMVVTCACDLFV